MSGHVSTSQLALHASGDLSVWDRWRVDRHLRNCEECAQVGEEFTRLRGRLTYLAAELPPGMGEAEWQSLASDMTANVWLGLAAGECVSVKTRLAPRPRLAFALAGLALVALIAGVESSRPGTAVPATPAADSGLRTLEASSEGLAVHSAGHMLSVSAPPGVDARDLIQTVNTRGDMHSRYTDDTGVTINAVYADAE